MPDTPDISELEYLRRLLDRAEIVTGEDGDVMAVIHLYDADTVMAKAISDMTATTGALRGPVARLILATHDH